MDLFLFLSRPLGLIILEVSIELKIYLPLFLRTRLDTELHNLLLNIALYPRRILQFLIEMNCRSLVHLLSLFCW